MTINKKLIHFNKKEDFEREVTNGNILNDSIVFIKDSKEIYTHGAIYNSQEEITNIKDSIETIKIKLEISNSNTMALDPNVYYRNTNNNLTQLTITFNTETDSTILNEYLVEFTTSSTGTTVILPASIRWVKTPTFENNTTYLISIVNNLGVVLEFK